MMTTVLCEENGEITSTDWTKYRRGWWVVVGGGGLLVRGRENTARDLILRRGCTQH